MAWSITDIIPPWGDSGERWSDNFSYQGGDQVNEKHLDYFIDSVGTLEDDVRSALQDIDSDQDGTVDDAENVTSTYKGNDIDSNGDGVVDDADNVTSTYKGNDIDSNGDGTVDESDNTLAIDGYTITVSSTEPASPDANHIWIDVS